LEFEKFRVSRENEKKLSDLEINKSLILQSSDNNLGQLERNLEVAK